MNSVATPATTIETRLTASCSAAPAISVQSLYAAATAILAAAGIVVIETRTPTSAPDLVLVNEIIPAIPASVATITENQSGWEMKFVSGWLASERFSGPIPSKRPSSAAT